MDETLALPSQKAAEIALRTQQILAHETGVSNVADPLGGSYLVEGLTSKIYELAKDEIRKIDDFGGSLRAIEAGFQQRQIHQSAFEFQKEIESEKRKIVGVNYAINDEKERLIPQSIDSAIRLKQIENIGRVISNRENELCEKLLQEINNISKTDENLFPKVIEAVKARCTLGEIVNSMRDVFGDYHPPSGF